MPKEAPPPVAYAFEDQVEKALTLAVCGEPRFYEQIGRAIEADRLRSPHARLLVSAAHAVAAKHNGRGPSWPTIAVQHLSTLSHQGKLTLEQLDGAKDYLLEAMELPPVLVDDLVATVVPVVRRVRHKEAIVEALDGYKNGLSPAETADVFSAVAKLGTSAGSTTATIQQIADVPGFWAQRPDDSLRFGIPELDLALEGGLEREGLGLVVGGSGAGKSMALVHAAVEAMLLGHDVLYFTLELSPERVTQRIVRNLTNMTPQEARRDPDLVAHRLRQVFGVEGVGQIVVVKAPPLVTSPRDLRVLMAQAEREHPRFRPQVFAVDFLDKLRVNPKASLYEDMLAVTDGLREIAGDHDGWTWTATQSDRKSTGQAWLDLDAVADSMNKIRSADVVMAIGRTKEDKESDMIRISVPKRREGEGAHTQVGPFPWDPARGRISVVSDRVYPWDAP